MHIALVKKSGHDGEPDEVFIVAAETDEEEIVVAGYETLEEGQKIWSGNYNRSHLRSYESSMSACMHSIMFQPRIHELVNVKELQKLVKNEDGFAMPVSLSCVAGQVMAFQGTDYASKAYETATTVELINEDFNRLKLDEKRKEVAELEALVEK